MFVRRVCTCVLALAASLALILPAAAQNIVSGDITGIVTDPSGAVLPNVTVTLKNNSTGQTTTTNTNTQGVYRFPLLNPGGYTLSAAATGFQAAQHTVTVT